MKTWGILTVTFFSFVALSAQYRITRCSELNDRPLVNNEEGGTQELLAIYLKGEGDSDVGGLDCWVLHHENDKDYVVIPISWHPDTGGVRQRLIDDAMTTITDSRRKYIEYGTMNKSLYYILNDVNYEETAGEKFFTYQDDQCWMRSGVPALSFDSRETRKQVFAHEIGHCFVEENVPKTAYTNHDWDAWFDESVSEFLSSEVYKTANREHMYSVQYNFDAPFMQPYNAYVLWYYYAKKHGKQSVVRLMRELADLNSLRARQAHLRSIGFDELFHNFLFDYTVREIKDSGTGEAIPGPNDMFDEEYTMEPASDKITLPEKIKDAQREFYLIEIPAGFNVTIHPPTGSSMTYFQSLMTSGGPGREGLMIRNWNSPQFVEGDCNRSQLAMVMVSHLNTEILGDLEVKYELEAKVDCCSGAEGTLDGCLVGEWKVDVSTVSHLLDYDISGVLKVRFENNPVGHLNAEFQLRFDFDNGDYDTHKGTVSACVVPAGSGGPLNYFKLTGVTLGPENVHTHFYSRKGKFLDQKDNVLEGLNWFKFNYTTCTPDILTVLYMVQMNRIR